MCLGPLKNDYFIICICERDHYEYMAENKISIIVMETKRCKSSTTYGMPAFVVRTTKMSGAPTV